MPQQTRNSEFKGSGSCSITNLYCHFLNIRHRQTIFTANPLYDRHDRSLSHFGICLVGAVYRTLGMSSSLRLCGGFGSLRHPFKSISCAVRADPFPILVARLLGKSRYNVLCFPSQPLQERRLLGTHRSTKACTTFADAIQQPDLDT